MYQTTRREFLKKAGTAASAAGLMSMGCSQGRQERQQPNVLIIMCDQLNANVLSCYGGEVPTPNINRIAQNGALFRQATCPAPFCSPSRASMITGLYPHVHGIVYNVNEQFEGIHPDDVTTERILFEAGYETTHFGKWHLHDEELPYYQTYYRDQHYGAEMKEFFEEVRKLPAEERMQFYNMPRHGESHSVS